jgi:hypothetical protein
MIDAHEGGRQRLFCLGEFGRGYWRNEGAILLRHKAGCCFGRGPRGSGCGKQSPQGTVGGKDQSIGIHGEKFSPLVVSKQHKHLSECDFLCELV